MSRRPTTGIRPTDLATALLVVLLVGLPAAAALDPVADLFMSGRYEEARTALRTGGEGRRAGEATLWEVQLATDPKDALVLLRESLADTRLPDAVRTRMVLEIADIEFGLGRYRSSMQALGDLLDDDQGQVPGDVYLRAGLALRAMGHAQKAREMLASVRPQDQAFLLARYYLGDIALDQKDPELALRYFLAAAGEREGGLHPRVAGGIWRAYLADDRQPEATALEADLAERFPGSLALLEIQRQHRQAAEERAAMGSDEDELAPASDEAQLRGRFALQLGAFSDRGLALEFLRRHRGQVPDLRIDEVRDQRGQFLYKVRSGAFVNPALARTEARRLADQLDMEVIVAELDDADLRDD